MKGMQTADLSFTAILAVIAGHEALVVCNEPHDPAELPTISVFALPCDLVRLPRQAACIAVELVSRPTSILQHLIIHQRILHILYLP